MIYHLVGHKILNKTLYYFKRYYFQILRYLRKCMKKFHIIEWFKILLHKLGHEYAKCIYKTAMPYIIIDVIWFIRRSIAARCCACCVILLYLFRPRTLAIPFLFVLSCFKYWNTLKFEPYTLKYDYWVGIIQFTMRAKITRVDICASFSLRRDAFLQKCPINRKLDVIEKNGFQIWIQHPKIG